MKWPNTFTIIRHGESEFNFLKLKQADSKGYEVFKNLFDSEFAKAETIDWPSVKLVKLAHKIWQGTKLKNSDFNTMLTDEGYRQAEDAGKKLKTVINVPDVVYISPYLRTKQTFAGLVRSWPALDKTKQVFEDRIREQEHGMQSLFSDRRIFNTLNPIQGLLSKLEGEYAYRHLNGESKADVKDRVRSFLATVIRENAGQNVLLVTHHITLLSIRATLERWSSEKFIEIDKNEKPINCGVTIYKGNSNLGRDGKLVLDIYNKKLY